MVRRRHYTRTGAPEGRTHHLRKRRTCKRWRITFTDGTVIGTDSANHARFESRLWLDRTVERVA